MRGNAVRGWWTRALSSGVALAACLTVACGQDTRLPFQNAQSPDVGAVDQPGLSGPGDGPAQAPNGATSKPPPSDASDNPGAVRDDGAMGDGGLAINPEDGADAGGPSPELHGTGPGDWTAGDYPPNLAAEAYLEIAGVSGQAGNVRQYKVHVPPSYDPGTPMPLVFCFHGLSQTPVMFCINSAKMPEKSDAEGFILVMPNGFQNSWNAGTCCGGASAAKLDDVALVRAIFAEVGEHLNVDLDRVYATGLSNGGYLSYRLACEAADLFAAVAPGAAAVGINEIGGGTNPASDFVTCEPSQPISVLDAHGTTDPLIPYMLQAPTLSLLQAANGCEATTVEAAAPISAGDTRCVTYEGCPAGIELTACTVEGGGHCWFGSPDCGTGAGDIGLVFVGNNSDTLVSTDAAWDFFARHHR